MTLYEYIQEKQRDFDVWDIKHDRCVTVVCIDEECDDYDRFINALLRKVDFIKEGCDSATIYADWSKFIENNLDKFKAFSKKHWSKQYDDKETFIYQWLRDIHHYFAGFVGENFYTTLLDFVKTLK